MSEDRITGVAIKQLKGLIYSWFVRYNPLYFFSALCVLTGVYLISKGINDLEWKMARFGLAGVIQVYEILLILGSALLFRVANKKRPAVILGFLEILFLFDCTFEIEAISAIDPGGPFTIVLWISLTAIKITLLAWAFRLKFVTEFFTVPLLAAAGLMGASKLLALGVVDRETVHLLATWFLAALTAIVLWRRPAASCAIDLDDWGRTVLRRAVKTAWIVWGTIYLIHLLSWSILYDLHLSLAHAAPFILLCPFISTKERWVWTGAIGAVAASFSEPQTISSISLMVALTLIWFGGYTRRYRLWTGAIMAFYLACWTLGLRHLPLPEPELWLNVVVAAVLLFIGLKLRIFSAFAIGLALVLFQTVNYGKSLDALGRGIMLLIIGFLSLILGISLNWKWLKIADEE